MTRSRFFPQRPTRSAYFEPRRAVKRAQEEVEEGGGGGYSENRKVRRARERRRKCRAGRRGVGSEISPPLPPPPSPSPTSRKRKRKRRSAGESASADQDPHQDTSPEDARGDFIVKELRTRRILIPDTSTESKHGPTRDAHSAGTLRGTTIPEAVRRKRMKRTGEVSSYFSEGRPAGADKRVLAGVSVIPPPPLTADTFGLIQEELQGNAYYVLVAAAFLSKTRGVVAVPLLRRFLADYPTPVELSRGDPAALTAFLRPLGLHRVRAHRLIQLGTTWAAQPPTPGVGATKRNYPARDTRPFEFACPLGDGLGVRSGCCWEVAHLPGVGAYALDCWRIFCRDRFRGVREEREWRRVVPKDKELRAYLRWRWAKEGWE